MNAKKAEICTFSGKTIFLDFKKETTMETMHKVQIETS